MQPLQNTLREALALQLAAGVTNARAACVAAGYSASVAMAKAHVLVKHREVLQRAKELRSIGAALARQDIERTLRPAQPQPAAQPALDPKAEAERKLFYAEQHKRDAERREREHQHRLREAEERRQREAQREDERRQRDEQSAREREQQRLASLPVPVASHQPGALEPALVRVGDDVRYALPSTPAGLGSVADFTPDQMRGWISEHLGAIAVEARLRGDRRAAISAADGLAKVHGLNTTKIEVTHRSPLDGLNAKQLLKLLDALDAADRGEIEFVPAVIESAAVAVDVEEDDAQHEVAGAAGALIGEIETCTTVVGDPLA